MNGNTSNKMDNVKQKSKRQLVTFLLSDERYGIDIMHAKEIIRMVNIMSVPNSLDFVLGVINLRGDIIPVIDLKRRFNLVSKTKSKGVIILSLYDSMIGISVDKILRVASFDENSIQPTPSVVSGVDTDYITGIVQDLDSTSTDNKLILILDINKLFN